MSRDKVILTDVDGTLVNFADPFHEWMEKRGYTVIEGRNLNNVFLIDDVFDCTPEQGEAEIIAFSDDPGFAHLPALEGAQEAVHALKADGWRIIAVTACHRSPAARAARIHNLDVLFGFEPDDILFAGKMAPKLSILQKYEPAIWVEDHLFHANEGCQAGHQCILIDRDYNQHKEGSPSIEHLTLRVKNWTQIRQYLDSIKSDYN